VAYQNLSGCVLPNVGRCMVCERSAAFSAELRALRIREGARRASQLELSPTLSAKDCVSEILGVALGAQHRGSCAQLIEQRLRVLQVGGVEALGKPVVDSTQYCARLVATICVAKEACKAGGRPQLP